MTDLLILKLGASPLDPVAWGAFTDGGLGEAGRVANVAALASVASRVPPEARVVGILQGEQVAMREISAPPKQSSKLVSAATLLLEDELAEPVEAMHVVVSDGPARAALAVSKALLREWVEGFAAAAIQLDELTVDFLSIGGSPTACVLVGDGGRIIAAHKANGFAAETALADIVAPGFIEAAGDAAVIAYGAHDLVGRWAQAPVERRTAAHEADVLALFGATISARGVGAEFLTGEFRRKQARSLKLGPWKRTAILAAGLAAAAIVTATAGGMRDGRVAAAYARSAEVMHRAAFPTYSDGDIRGHARELLARGVKSASFLEMTSLLTESLKGHEGVAIDRIRFDAARGQYVFSIRSDSDAGIEAFRATLDANGLAAEDSGGYRRSGEAWVGEMTARRK